MPAMKRSIDSISGSADTISSDTSSQAPRAESPELPGSNKRKPASTTRTGQACDRCKIRKIRCDARPGGCSPCAQNKTECKTTDRITGRATSRGHTESLESENNALKQHLADLRRQLREHGIEPHARSSISSGATPTTRPTTPSPPSRRHDPHNLANILNPLPDDQNRATFSSLPTYRADSAGDNYLGVSSANEWPCPASGTQLSILGMPLDLIDFVAVKDVEFVKPTSYEAFMDYAFRDPQPVAPKLPPYEQTRILCEYWFKLGNSWMPVLHKPHFMAMVEQVYYEEGFEMTTPQTVQFHALLAIMLYQFNVRNRISSEYKWSDHYRYALSFYAEMLAENALPAMQAVTMILCSLRGFSQPGAFWTVSVQALSKAVEMGLHRSIKAWDTCVAKMDPHEVEMRKRVFWTTLQCHAIVGSRLGRPINVRLDDFDVEIPEPLHDNLPQESDEPDNRKCSFLASIVNYKFLVVQLNILSSLFTVRPIEQNYEQLQKNLAKDLDLCRASIPPHLRGRGQKHIEDQAISLYLEYTYHAMRLVVYHPALSRRPEKTAIGSDIDICLAASSGMLRTCKELLPLRMLDTTWHNTVQLLSAVFTTLFAYTEKKDKITLADLGTLTRDMHSWLQVTEEVGITLGSGKQINNALAKIIASVLGDLKRHIAARDGGVRLKVSETSNADPVSTKQEVKAHESEHDASVTVPQSFNGTYAQPQTPVQSTFVAAQQQMATQGYPTNTSYSYSNPPERMPSYTESMYTDAYSNSNKPDMTQLSQAGLTAGSMGEHGTQQTHQYLPRSNVTSHPHSQQPQPQQAQQQLLYPSNPSQPNDTTSAYAAALAWRTFADNMTSSIQGGQHWNGDALLAFQHQTANDATAHGSTPLQSPVDPPLGGPSYGLMAAANSGLHAGTPHQHHMGAGQMHHQQGQQQGQVGVDTAQAGGMSWPMMGMFVGQTQAQ